MSRPALWSCAGKDFRRLKLSFGEITRMGRPVTDIDRAFNVQVRCVVVIAAKSSQKLNDMSAAYVIRASEQPFLVMVTVYEKNYSHDHIQSSGILAVNYLQEGKQKLAIYFGKQSGREVD